MDKAGAILKGAPQAHGELRPDVPGLLQHIVKKMLAKDARDRYPSIHDVRIDLRELLEEPDGRWIASQWNLTDRGIYAINSRAKPVAAISFYDSATRRVASLAPIHSDPRFRLYEGLSVSPDGKWLACDGGIFTSDLMMIENFH